MRPLISFYEIAGGVCLMQSNQVKLVDFTTELAPAQNALPRICLASPNPEDEHHPIRIAYHNHIADIRQSDCPSLVQRAHLSSLLFERSLSSRFPRASWSCHILSMWFRRLVFVSFATSCYLGEVIAALSATSASRQWHFRWSVLHDALYEAQ
jgi:hypothetical protein